MQKTAVQPMPSVKTWENLTDALVTQDMKAMELFVSVSQKFFFKFSHIITNSSSDLLLGQFTCLKSENNFISGFVGFRHDFMLMNYWSISEV